MFLWKSTLDRSSVSLVYYNDNFISWTVLHVFLLNGSSTPLIYYNYNFINWTIFTKVNFYYISTNLPLLPYFIVINRFLLTKNSFIYISKLTITVERDLRTLHQPPQFPKKYIVFSKKIVTVSSTLFYQEIQLQRRIRTLHSTSTQRNTNCKKYPHTFHKDSIFS